MSHEQPDEFYVGYLPLAVGYRKFVRWAVPVLIVGALVNAAVLAMTQNEPSSGTWDLAEPVTVTGAFQAAPYPMIVVPEDGDQAERTILLVTMGKMGIGSEDALVEGQSVSVTGFPIGTSDGTMLLAIASPDVDLSAEEDSTTSTTTALSLGQTSLSGQIIDPKCYFGAMKPGEGKVHKACATLCIRGGIPPMFMTIDAAGDRTYYLLLNESGAGIVDEQLDQLLPYVADPVTLEGELERRGGMLILKTDPATIRRL